MNASFQVSKQTSVVKLQTKLKINRFVLPAEMVPEKPRSTWSEADDIERHTDQQNEICDGVVHQLIIVQLSRAAFSIHQLFATH